MMGKIIFLGLVLAFGVCAAGEAQTWTGKTGAKIEATFIKEERGVVTLKRKDGAQVQVKLEALCDDDREYVKDLTYEAKEVKAVFKRTRGGGGLTLVKGSDEATVRDSLVVMVDLAVGDAQESIVEDSRWSVVSVDTLGKSVAAGGDDSVPVLSTEGVFVFVTYRVHNGGRAPVAVVSPRLIDSEERVFSQAVRSNAHNYIPDGTKLAGQEHLQPGFAKLFCAFYEIPEDATPLALEIFPCLAGGQMMTGGHGKRIVLSRGKPEVGEAPGGGVDASSSGGGKSQLFMNCVRVASSGSSSGSYVRDKTRSLSYAANLRSTGMQAINVKVVGYFIGETAEEREVILDMQESEVTLEAGRANRVTLTSKEISETRLRSWVLGDVRQSGGKLKGAIIQALSGGEICAGWASLPQWRKYAENPNLVKELGVAKMSDE